MEYTRSGSKIIAAVFMFALAGCGGGGGGGEPTLKFTDASVGPGDDPKELAFTWTFDGSGDAFRLEVNSDGASGFVPVDTNEDGTADAGDEIAGNRSALDLPIELLTADFANALYQVVALDDQDNELDRSDELSIAGLVEALIGYFKASNTGAEDSFGGSIALSGDGETLAVGSAEEDSDATGIDGADNDNASDAGAVYIFTKDGASSWSQQAYVKASNTTVGDLFGTSVTLSEDGNTLAVGASNEDSDATGIDGADNGNASNSGAVYVFTRDGGGSWSEQAYIKASNTGIDDRFGLTVALSDDGDTLAVGAMQEDSTATGIDGMDNDNVTDSGAVYMFTRDGGGNWSQQAYVKAFNTDQADRFGISVALSSSGDTLAVGASSEGSDATGIDGPNNNNATASGAVYVFTRDGGGNWSQQAYVKASNTGAGDSFGFSVALSDDGNTLAASAPDEDSSFAGINGTDDDNRFRSGAAYVFTRDGAGDWSQQAFAKASNPGSEDSFGGRFHAISSDLLYIHGNVALSGDGDMLAVGAEDEDGDATGIDGPDNNNAGGSGAVYVFTRDGGSTWSQLAYVKASNTGSTDAFGASVALSSDGKTMAIGAADETGAATGIGGADTGFSDDAGAVYLY